MPSSAPNAPSDFTTARARLLAELRAEGITDSRVLHALAQVPREEFVRPEDRSRAYDNRALAIGGGQTISQPYIVAVMTQLAELHSGDRVLEIGTGSGYQAAVLSALTLEVYSIEIDPVLADTARQRLVRLGYRNVTVRAGDGFYGWEEQGPFDAVVVTAAAPRIPERLVAQLKVGGRLLMPLGEGAYQTLIRGRKTESGLAVERFDDVLFVPMTGAIRSQTP
ncbi:MAG: protein-L-isoaspartate(D-aspartate) O-methyltransferase [Candidatus Binatia bacterium]